jgi:hypothetical protein
MIPLIPPVSAPEALANSFVSSFDPDQVIPDVSVFKPAGAEYVDDRVPETFDFSQRSRVFIQGMIQSLSPPTPTTFRAPYGSAHFDKAVPHFGPLSTGVPNWGKVAQALMMARLMSGYDLDDKDHTLNAQYEMTRNMIDAKVNSALINHGAWLVIPHPEGAITPMTACVEALIQLYLQSPSPELKGAINSLIAYHIQFAKPITDPVKDVSYLHYYSPCESNARFKNSLNTTAGYFGYYWTQAFIHGKASRALATWQRIEPAAGLFGTIELLNNYLRFYDDSKFWDTRARFGSFDSKQGRFVLDPAPVSDVPPGAAHFIGHVHSYLNALMALLWEAEIRMAVNPGDGRALDFLNYVKAGYEFVRDFQRAGEVGNFGETCTVGDMLRIATRLTDLNVKDYYEDVDKYLRNQVSESQIIDRTLIPSYPSSDDTQHHVGGRVTGTFFSDSTHAFAIPASEAFSWNVCCQGNIIMGMYEAWKRTVQYKGSFAQINLLMNRASRYLDVRSEIPYRGFIEVVTKNLGPIRSMGVRIPDWVQDKHSVRIGLDSLTNPVPFSWVAGNYAQVDDLLPNRVYVVYFPMTMVEKDVLAIAPSKGSMWQEANAMSENGRYYLSTYSGVFRGNDLIRAQGPTNPDVPIGDIATGLYGWRDFLVNKPTDLRHAAPRRVYSRFAPTNEP